LGQRTPNDFIADRGVKRWAAAWEGGARLLGLAADGLLAGRRKGILAAGEALALLSRWADRGSE
jgi:hypothetical protein